jgi:hypothetical protein
VREEILQQTISVAFLYVCSCQDLILNVPHPRIPSIAMTPCTFEESDEEVSHSVPRSTVIAEGSSIKSAIAQRKIDMEIQLE